MTKPAILLTGGCGFIGSHVAVVLHEAGYRPIIIDNFDNAEKSVTQSLASLTDGQAVVVEGAIQDEDLVERVLREYSVSAVMHFAGLKAVGESVAQPLRYYQENIGGTLALLRAMGRAGVKQLIFSSSSTVYGTPKFLPLTEAHPTQKPTNPYGRTKLMIEEILEDLVISDPSWHVVSLRYFNPVGAHESGLIGESPLGMPNNLMPFIVSVAQGRREKLAVFGDDYETPDGTGVRDYIHVMDLAEGHALSLPYLAEHAGFHVFNLGCGHGFSVLEMIRTFEDVNGVKVPYTIAPRRDGDIAQNYADPARAEKVLGWKAKRDLAQMCRDAWLFAQKKMNR